MQTHDDEDRMNPDLLLVWIQTILYFLNYKQLFLPAAQMCCWVNLRVLVSSSPRHTSTGVWHLFLRDKQEAKLPAGFLVGGGWVGICSEPLIILSVPSKHQRVMAGSSVYSLTKHLVGFPVNLMSQTLARPFDPTRIREVKSNAITPGNTKKHLKSNYGKLDFYLTIHQGKI